MARGCISESWGGFRNEAEKVAQGGTEEGTELESN